MTQKIRVWISQYALTKGLFEIEVERSTADDTLVSQRLSGGFTCYYHKPHWHLTLQEAVNRAITMRDAAIKSTEKRLAKLRKTDFRYDNS